VDPRVTEILGKVSSTQRMYVFKRLIYPDVAKAARAMGLHRSTPHNWPNLAELEEAVTLLSLEMVPAARNALESLALEAVQTLARGLVRSDAASIRAAEAVFNRIGLPAMSNVDVTSQGEQLKAVVYIPDNGRDDRD